MKVATSLLDAMPAKTDIAFILVQHLDPDHPSLMAELLARHTALAVLEAAEGMALERDHLYVIPPGKYLSVSEGLLRLSAPTAGRGARLPFNFLLQSVAESYGSAAVCVVLSGTGDDGSEGLRAVKAKSGYVIVQDPAEAEYAGMPESAIATGAVDDVLPVAKIAAKLIDRARGGTPALEMERSSEGDPASSEPQPDHLADILEFLHANHAHDFTPYKPGTLRRRIERRMAMVAITPNDTGRYLDVLRADPKELDQVAKDLLIHVTGFFRDPDTFKLLADTIVPELLDKADRQVRVWIAGCSTGEEAYSLAMLFRERITAADDTASRVKLQVFASDVDADAVAVARAGLYPAAIQANISPDRLARFFTKEEQGFRITPELRAAVVFTVQDLLADPPFSRLDLVSCRNLMIYLDQAAQAKAVALFHFALNENGVLLLGGAETVDAADDRFKVISKPARLFRHVGRRRPGDLEFVARGDTLQLPKRPGRGDAPSRQSVLARLCSKYLIDTHAPATVLSNRKCEYLFSMGPTERYLRVAAGQPTQDLLAMVREDTRIRLRLAIERAVHENARISVPGGRTNQDGRHVPFAIEVQPIEQEGEALLLICFVDQAAREPSDAASSSPANGARVAELEKELETVRAELQSAVRNLDLSSQEQKAINEEALSVNEEFQSTNEELLTSKEELQSLNEELTALNSQLQGTLAQQRTTSNDMQNVLNSTDVATLFLDTELRIRFFTPATHSLFSMIEGDVGRPLADLRSIASDGLLDPDARAVLKTLAPVEREISAPDGVWFRRRILPYRTHDGSVEGVVITFNDITRRKQAASALEDAKLEAERANKAKSRFLAAASHDLRQPLQTLALLQGLLANGVEGENNKRLVARLDDTLGAMSGMLNTLLDINQIEAGIVRAELATFPINGLLNRLRDEFGYPAQAQGLTLRVVPCSLSVHSDTRLLEQIIRNLLSNALKYTKRGGVLLGCRRRHGVLSIEVWDSGVGIPEAEQAAIFEEYHQLDNAARERSRGLGLGLSIVKRLSALLHHPVRIESHSGKGSMFAVEVALPPEDDSQNGRHDHPAAGHARPECTDRSGVVLVVEDDPAVRELLEILLVQAGHRVHGASDGPTALELVGNGNLRPDVILSDYNLPNGMSGLDLAARLRQWLNAEVPAIILTGDISGETIKAIAAESCVQLNKPVKPNELTLAIQRLLLPSPERSTPSAKVPLPAAAAIYIVDDDRNIRETLRAVLEQVGRTVEDYSTSEAFLAAHRTDGGGCLLIDAYLPGMSGLELLKQLRASGDDLPAIVITGNSDVPMAVEAMKAGASDFVEKPIAASDLIACIERALERSRDSAKRSAWREEAKMHVASLTPRQREIMTLVLAGHPSKNIATDIGISQRTVENHRASIMRKTGAKSLPALARLALAAAGGSDAASNQPAVAAATAAMPSVAE